MAGTTQAWYRQGDDGFAHRDNIEKEIEERQKNYIGRFWMRPQDSRLITFLDSNGFFLYEHNFCVNGSWNNYRTCLKEFSECPYCDAGNRSAYVCAYTIIDHSEWEDKKGNVHKNEKKLYVVKFKVMPKWARKKKDECSGDLTYCTFKLYRDSRDEVATGADITFMKRLTKEQVLRFKPSDQTPEEFLAPYDYLEYFKPRSVDELRKDANQYAVGSEKYEYNGNGSDNSKYTPPDVPAAAADADVEALL